MALECYDLAYSLEEIRDGGYSAQERRDRVRVRVRDRVRVRVAVRGYRG